MRKRPAPALLAARFLPNPLAFGDLQVATLKMPYGMALWNFQNWLEKHFENRKVADSSGKWLTPRLPYRLLNSALFTCSPNIAHGFEWYSGKDRTGRADKGFRMLVVAKPGEPLAYPSVERVADVMRQWIRAWHDGAESQWLREAVAAYSEAWETLLAAMNEVPDTNWRTDYNLSEILTHTGQEGGLAFDLIPNLIATLLHDTQSVIQGKTVRWQRMQEGGKHLCLLSDPLPVTVAKSSNRRGADGTYTKGSVSHDAFFCYKVEIRLQNQTGLETPWVYFKPHCTRLASLPVTFNKRGNELTLLVGTNEPRLTGWPSDTTLVRLKASRNATEAIWLDDLPRLLERIGARPLQLSKEICAKPTDFWHSEEGGLLRDKYFVVHTEGYKYKGTGPGSLKHPVMAGLPLPEQAEIIGALTTGEILRSALTPDKPITADPFGFDPHEEPVILRNIEEIRKYHGITTEVQYTRAGLTREQARQRQCDHWRPIVLESITRATRGKRLVIACFYSSSHTLDWIKRGLWQNSLLLPEGGVLPDEVTLLPIPLPADQMSLVKPCPKDTDGKPQRPPATSDWREALLLRWRELLQTQLGKYQADNSLLLSAIVELDPAHDREKATILDRESAHSVIREAFARENIRVQMTLPIRKGVGNAQFDAGETGRSLNVVQEVVSRQLGAVLASPTPLYQGIGLDNFGEPVSQNLDVIAFSFRSAHSGLRYCVATRLRVDGTVDVMLPGTTHTGKWIPYAEAYTRLGVLFGEARKYLRNKNQPCPLRLEAAEAAGFVESVLTTCLDRPTVAIIEAEGWRQSSAGHGGWWQLTNSTLTYNRDVLLFSRGKERQAYHRTDANPTTANRLLAVIRLRTGDETPGYVTNRSDWHFDGTLAMPNYGEITGFWDDRPGIFHYLSVNKVGATSKKQPQHGGTAKPVRYRIAGSPSPFKHAPLIEMVPFFVAPEFDNPEGLQALCRIPHYFRVHPGWGMGEINSPYLLHLGDTLIKDQETILGTD